MSQIHHMEHTLLPGDYQYAFKGKTFPVEEMSREDLLQAVCEQTNRISYLSAQVEQKSQVNQIWGVC